MNAPELTAVIVDDEHTARYGLASYINKTRALRCVGEFHDIMSLESFLRNNVAPDIIFMDICMPDISGLDFVASRTLDSAVIIVTAYDQFALKGFDLNVCDYLLKPVSYSRFLQAVDKTSKYVYYRKGLIDENYIFLRAERMMHRIRISDIDYIESMENYVKVVTHDEKVITRSTLKDILSELSGKGIIQIHKSYAVNIGRINMINGYQIITNKGNILPLSRKYRDSLLMYVNVDDK